MKPPCMKQGVLLPLTKRSYNHFEAEHELADHCLNSRTRPIQIQHDIPVTREMEIVRGFHGIPLRVFRRWIETEHVDSALKLMKFWS